MLILLRILALLSDLSTITTLDSVNLTDPITKTEIYKTLFSLHYGNSPGPDGYNVEFYHLFWNDAGNYLLKVVYYSLSTFPLSCSWWQTYMALIPKN